MQPTCPACSPRYQRPQSYSPVSLSLDRFVLALRTRIIATSLEVSTGGFFVQFSDAPSLPVPGFLCVHHTAIVWRNLPPAAVFVVRA